MKVSSGFLFVFGSFLAIGSLTNIVGCSDDTGGTGSSESSSSSSSTSSSSSSSSSTGGGGAGGGPNCSVGTPCEQYCCTMGVACTGANAQYADAAQCKTICATWPAGAAGAMDGNSLACRTYHGGVAAGMPDVHCPHAGPYGDGACGSSCENFCALAKAACAGALFPYADDATCMSDCAGFAAMPPYSQTNASGDNLGCREYHLSVAAKDAASAATHCPHAGKMSATCK